jgi:signal transduction histidine kinase
MRSFIRGLRPASAFRSVASVELADRLEALRHRVERQWSLAVNLHLNGAVERVPAELRNDVYHLTQEAVINAARHAEASAVSVELSVTGPDLRIEVVDDGRGFPFRGTFDLDALNEMRAGPLTLKERVARLAGDLTLTSTDTGTAVHMKLPLEHASD